MGELVLHDVGMRDGLQVEDTVVPTERKIAWIDALLDAGVDAIQVGSFVSPKLVPQMADTGDLFAHYARRAPARTRLTALVLNEKGLERGLAAGVRHFCMGVSASEAHSRRNTGMAIEEACVRILRMADAAVSAGATVQLSVQSAFGCGYEGRIPPDRVIEIARRFIGAGFRTVSLADTAGHATPRDVRDLFCAIGRLASDVVLACHFHDTYGLAMANACAALDAGVRSFEAAFAGLGGCPFTALAGGNLCTEDFLHMCQRDHRLLGISLDRIVALSKDAEAFFGRPLPGVVHRTGAIPWQ
jgi:hydroxymethylglutaryl-CoA lyase